MNETELLALLRRIAKAGLGRLPKKQNDRSALLALSLTALDPAGIFDEAEIDDHLSRWLAALQGTSAGVDHVTWRRALVDAGMLRRASDGAIYRIRPERVEAELTVDARSINPAQIFVEVERSRAALLEARKQAAD